MKKLLCAGIWIILMVQGELPSSFSKDCKDARLISAQYEQKSGKLVLMFSCSDVNAKHINNTTAKNIWLQIK